MIADLAMIALATVGGFTLTVAIYRGLRRRRDAKRYGGM